MLALTICCSYLALQCDLGDDYCGGSKLYNFSMFIRDDKCQSCPSSETSLLWGNVCKELTTEIHGQLKEFVLPLL